jgi:hypothetical protein
MFRIKPLPLILAVLTLLLAFQPAATTAATGGRDSSSWCGTWDWGLEVSLARHALNQRRQGQRFTVQSASTDAADNRSALKVSSKGKVAIIQDSGEIVIDRNPFDYQNKGVKYLRKGKSGFKVKTQGGSVNQSFGEKLNLGDDDAVRVDLPDFRIKFYGKNYDSFFVNSDGNITFKKSDTASTARDLRRMLVGPPRISPLFADLDPSSASGEGGVFVRFAEGKVTVTWWNVPNFGERNLNNFSVTINARGNIEYQFGIVSSKEAIVGVAPGGGSGLDLVDLTQDLPTKAKGVAIAERFSKSVTVDEAAVAETFISSFGDNFDQVVLFTDFVYILDDSPGTIAYHMTVNNKVRGIGRAVYNASQFYGSSGRLGGFINMGHTSKYPKNLFKDNFIDDLYSAIDILAHEIGHQWLVGARFVDSNGQTSDDLLGRAGAHWSYYFNSEQSFLEGNAIQDNGGGSFTTFKDDPTYNDLDLYMMGLLPAGKVSSFWYVQPTSSQDTDTAAPEAGVTFQGTRVDLDIQQIQDALGPRRPASGSSQNEFRLGFVLLTKNGKSPSTDSLNKVNEFANEIEKLFRRETRNLGRIDAGL